MREYFPKSNFLGAYVKAKLDLSNYAIKAGLKNATGVYTWDFAKKTDLANSKSNIDKLDIDKLKNVPTNLGNLKSNVDKLDVDKSKPVPVDLSKLSEVVKNFVVKEDVYNATIKNSADKIPDITNLTTKITLNAKMNEVKGEMSNYANLATTAALNVKRNEVKGKIPSITKF